MEMYTPSARFVIPGIYIYEEIILQFFAFWPKIVCCIPENLREKNSALIFSSITLSNMTKKEKKVLGHP